VQRLRPADHKARLQALPFAERCRDCAQAREELAAETGVSNRARRSSESESEVSAPAPRRPGVPRGVLRASVARLARPGQLELRRQVSGMERASRRDIVVPPGAEPATAPAPAASSRRAGRVAARRARVRDALRSTPDPRMSSRAAGLAAGSAVTSPPVAARLPSRRLDTALSAFGLCSPTLPSERRMEKSVNAGKNNDALVEIKTDEAVGQRIAKAGSSGADPGDPSLIV